jgi:hypothetical protein
MAATAKQLEIATTIDAKVQALLGKGCNDAIILAEMSDYMSGFKLLLDSSSEIDFDELCERFPSFHRFTKLLENVAAAIQSGAFADILGETRH